MTFFTITLVLTVDIHNIFIITQISLTVGETETFLNVAKNRLALLLNEMDEKKGSTGDAWLTSEALAVTEAHRGGTFR